MSDTFWSPDGLDAFVEAVGTCNLSCPACGNGHLPRSRPSGLLDPDHLDRILDKLEAEAPGGGRPRVHLFNWGEPLLHPALPELIRRVRRRDLSCRLSSNLVRPRDLDAVIAASPDWFRVSVSGYTQAVYGRSHRGGDVDRVKANLVALRGAIDRHRAATVVEVNYHVYRHNVGPDYAAMRALATGLGFEFRPVWSIPGSLEKVLEWEGTGVPPSDAEHVARLAISPAKMQEIARRHADQLAPGTCPLRDSTLVNVDGSVDLCCASYTGRIADDYLAVPADELAARKRSHDLCGACMAGAWHLVFLQAGQSEWNAAGLAALEADGAAGGDGDG